MLGGIVEGIRLVNYYNFVHNFRCVAIIDDKVEKIYGKKMQDYFDAHDIELSKLVFAGNEVDKDISTVERMLVSLKKMKVARNHPVLVVGGGVISDTAGFATALYHRNTPYVMLCTSIVSGIDAGPSPRTCCDGFGFKNLYGAYHPPVLTLTDRSFYRSLHHGWLRHGIAEIVKMAVVKDKDLFCLLEEQSSTLIWTKFGTEMEDYDGDHGELGKVCDLIIGKALEGYVTTNNVQTTNDIFFDWQLARVTVHYIFDIKQKNKIKNHSKPYSIPIPKPTHNYFIRNITQIPFRPKANPNQ